MNGIGLAIYLYFGFLSFILGSLPLYLLIKYSKLEANKIRNKAIIQYKDNLKNLCPQHLINLFLSFLISGLIVGILFYYITKTVIIPIAIIACVLFMVCVVGLIKYPVYITKDGFYFIRAYTWKEFNGYEKIGNKIKLIGKKWTSIDVYLRDEDGKLEEILKKYFKY